MSVPNRYTLITGASSGIGRGIAKVLSRNHLLILHGRDTEALEQTKRICANSDSHLIWTCDLEEINQLEGEFTDFLMGNQVFVDNFVHSAGMVHVMPTRLVNLEVAQRLMNVNFFAAFELSKLLVQRKKNNRMLKSIVFVSSINSKYGAKGQSMYCASKGALDALMKSLAVELSPDVRVNSVLPGVIKTKMSEHAFQNQKYISKVKDEYLLDFGSVEDIGNAVDFLLSEKAKWITGHQMVVDGGFTAH